jgi:hypothetical protein
MNQLRSTLNTDAAPAADPAVVPPMHRAADSKLDRKPSTRIVLRAKTRMRSTIINGATVRPPNHDCPPPFPGGDVEFMIYDDPADWLGLSKKVETEFAMLEAAKVTTDRERRESIARYVGNDRGGKFTADDIPADESHWSETMRKADRKCPASIESSFQKLMGRSIRPFWDLEVVLRDVPPPMGPGQVQGHKQTQMLADALASAGVGGGGMDEARLAAVIAATVKAVLADERAPSDNGGNKGGKRR